MSEDRERSRQFDDRFSGGDPGRMDQLSQRVARLEVSTDAAANRNIQIDTKLDKIVDMLSNDRVSASKAEELLKTHETRLDDHDDDIEAIKTVQRHHTDSMKEAKTVLKIGLGIASVLGGVLAELFHFFTSRK